MKKSIFAFIVLFAFLLGCSDLQDDISADVPQTKNDFDQSSINIENGRLSFPDSKSYFSAIDKISTMNDEEFVAWENAHAISSLRKRIASNLEESDTDLEYFSNLTNGYLSILNENAEVLIGDTIVWYTPGTKYFVPNKDEALLTKIRENQSLAELKGIFKIAKVEPKSQEGSSNGRIYPQSGIGVVPNGYQYTFAWCVNGTSRKYVDELYSVTDATAGFPGGYSIVTTLLLRIKLEWLSSKGWKVAGEYRKISYNFTSSLRFWYSYPNLVLPTGGGYYVTPYSGTTTRNSDLIIQLYHGSGNHYYENPDVPPFYDVELTGYIEQSITTSTSPGGSLCNTYRAPYSGAGTGALLW